MRRRAFVGGLAAASMSVPSGDEPLRDLAAARNIVFGTEITLSDITADPAYAALVARECAIITPGIEAKWPAIEPDEGTFRFGPLDGIVAFARRNGLRLHMHNLIWAVGLPAWTLDALAAGRGGAVMASHISAEAGRYRHAIDSWDVVNELADPRWPSDAQGICTTPWWHGVGPQFAAMAVNEAHLADPDATLLINDDDLEYEAAYSVKKRGIYLRLIEKWLRDGVKLTGFGLEAHLKPWLPIAHASYRRFLHDLAGFGLKIYVTEFDVCDRNMNADIQARDAEVAAQTRAYFDLVLDEPAVRTVITWGLSDNVTWMLRDPTGRRRDGLAPRPLPYDRFLRPKPMRAALAASFRAAPHRPA